ncbi:MAG: hypothetical protein COZ59_07785 [Bacteroidetes bacterium CG_4_8_14_3_um_filter_31_14]|nr:MAG: hypothetical protein COZ59_07785 [Bacteroidetes bacterium CG_4_8_14_3_um_filter_31_14]
MHFSRKSIASFFVVNPFCMSAFTSYFLLFLSVIINIPEILYCETGLKAKISRSLSTINLTATD